MTSRKRASRPSPTGAARQQQIRQQPPTPRRPAGSPPTQGQILQTVAAQGQAIHALRDVVAFVASAAGLERHPWVASVMRTAAEPADEPTDDYEAGAAEGERDAEAGTDLGTAEATRRFAAWSPRRQVGWADGYQRVARRGEPGAGRRTAADEERDPVAMTSEEALVPAATDDPTSIGAAPAGANRGVTPAAVTDPVSTDVAIPTQPFNKLVDPTSLAGPDSPPSVGDSHVEYDITSEKPNTDVPFKETGWTASSSRTFSAIRLARLRIQAGAAEGDADDEALQRATAASQSRRQAAARQSPPARRGMVPQPAQRQVPSLATTASGAPRTAAGGVPAGAMSKAGAQFGDLP